MSCLLLGKLVSIYKLATSLVSSINMSFCMIVGTECCQEGLYEFKSGLPAWYHVYICLFV